MSVVFSTGRDYSSVCSVTRLAPVVLDPPSTPEAQQGQWQSFTVKAPVTLAPGSKGSQVLELVCGYGVGGLSDRFCVNVEYDIKPAVAVEPDPVTNLARNVTVTVRPQHEDQVDACVPAANEEDCGCQIALPEYIGGEWTADTTSAGAWKQTAKPSANGDEHAFSILLDDAGDGLSASSILVMRNDKCGTMPVKARCDYGDVATDDDWVEGEGSMAFRIDPPPLVKPGVTVIRGTITAAEATVRVASSEWGSPHTLEHRQYGDGDWGDWQQTGIPVDQTRQSGDQVSRTLAGLSPDTMYQVRVKAIATLESCNSDATSLAHTFTTPAASGSDPLDTEPTAPQASGATSSGPDTPTLVDRTSTSLTVEIDEVQGATYQWRIHSDAGSLSSVSPEDSSTPETTLSGLEPNTRYYIDVRTEISGNLSDYSDDYDGYTLLTTPGMPTQDPDARTSSSFTIQIDPVAGATGYSWRLRKDSAPNDAYITKTVGSTMIGSRRQFVLDGLESETRYFIKVRAEHSSQENHSAYSVYETGRTLLSTPGEPTLVERTSTSLRLQTNVVERATGYNWRISTDATINDDDHSVLVKGNAKNGVTLMEVKADGNSQPTPLKPNTIYYIDVRAEQEQRRSDSKYSTGLAVRTSLSPPTPRLVSETVSSLTLQVVDPVSGATGYKWRISSDATINDEDHSVSVQGNGASEVTLMQVKADGVPQPVKLEPDTLYYIDVRAEHSSQENHSEYISTTARTSCSPLSRPEFVEGTENSLKVRVAPKQGATRYHWRIRSDTDNDGRLDLVPFEGGDTQETTLSGLESNTLYHVDVSATVDGSKCEYSPYLAVRTSLVTPETPTVDGRTASSLTVQVKPVEGATGYQWIASPDATIDTEGTPLNDHVVTDFTRVNSRIQAVLGGLEPNTIYHIFVRAENSSQGNHSKYNSSLTAWTLLPSPENLGHVHDARTSSSLTVQADSVEGATGYRWRISKLRAIGDAFDDETDFTMVDSRIQSVLDGLESNTRYHIDVRAEHSSQENHSEYSPAFAGWTLLETPDTPTLVAKTPDSLTVRTNAVLGAAKYRWRIHSDTDRDGTFEFVSSDTTSTTLDAALTGLEPGTAYQIDVSAESSSRRNHSKYSEDLAETTPVVAQPTLVPDTRTSTSLTVRTRAVPGATSYRWRISTDADIDDTDPSFPSGTHETTLMELEPDTRYYMDVGVVTPDGTSEYSANLEAFTLLPTPEIVNFHGTGTHSIYVFASSANSSATGYRWRISTNAAISRSEHHTPEDTPYRITLSQVKTNGVVGPLQPDTDYHIDVRAEGPNGNPSKYSINRIVKTWPVLPKPVLVPDGDAITGTSLTVQVDPVPGAVKYVWRYSKSKDPDTLVDGGSTTTDSNSARLTGLEPDTLYYIDAYAPTNNYYYSGDEDARIEYSPKLAVRTLLATPEPKLVAETLTSITVQADPVPGATSYGWRIGPVDGNGLPKTTIYAVPDEEDSQVVLTQVRLKVDGSLVPLTPGTSYYVNVRAENDMKGNHSVRSSHLLVHTVPVPPENLTLISRTSTSLTVQADEVLNATGYRWLISEDDMIDSGDTIVIDYTPAGSSVQVVLGQLESNTLYHIYAGTESGYGYSEYSAGLAEYTLLETPEPRLVAETTTSLTVQAPVAGATGYDWRIGPVDGNGSPETMVYAERSNTDSRIELEKVKLSDGGVSMSLSANTRYYVNVRAKNNTQGNHSVRSSHLLVRTADETSPPGNLRHIHDERTSTSLTVRADKVPNATGYQWLISKDGRIDVNDAVETDYTEPSPSHIQAVLRQLEPNTSYRIYVRANLGSSNTEYSAALNARTLLATPAQPWDDEKTPNSLMVRTHPVDGATKYRWRISTSTAITRSEHSIKTSTDPFTTLDRVMFEGVEGLLQSGTIYHIDVRAEGGGRNHSKYSLNLRVRTPPASGQ